MTRHVLDLDVLKAALNARLDSLVMQLYPAARRDEILDLYLGSLGMEALS